MKSHCCFAANMNVTDTKDRLPSNGINTWVAMLFVLGAMAGAGVMAIPTAFLNAGWWAVPMIATMSGIGCLTGFQLSWCWTILQENWPEYLEHTRNPYTEIGYRAGGTIMKYCVQTCVNLCMFMGAVAFLVLSCNNIAHLVGDWFDVKINFCYMVLIIAAILLPFSFLGTPKDFWPVSVGAIGSTALTLVFIIIGTLIDMPTCRSRVHYPQISLKGFISAYSTITFAYSSHAGIPTIQNDMRNSNKMPISVLVSFAALFVMYLPMPILAYVVYGHTIQGTIDQNLSSKWIRDAIIFLITGHVLFAFLIVVNPVAQDVERLAKIPLEFSWKRICTRITVVGCIVFIALTMPDFNALLELMGGTTSAAGAYIFPGPFYLLLRAKIYKKNAQSDSITDGSSQLKRPNVFPKSIRKFFGHESSYGANIPFWEYVLTAMVVSIGLIGAVATIYGVFGSEARVKIPCYLTGMQLERNLVANTTVLTEHCWITQSIFNNETIIT